MIRQMYSDLTPEERAVATPDPTKLVSFGETTKFTEVLTSNGVKTVVVTYEVLCEREYGPVSFGQRVWFRFKDNPTVLVPQFDLQKRDTTVQEEPYTADELAAMRASLPSKPTPTPDPPPQVLFSRPSW